MIGGDCGCGATAPAMMQGGSPKKTLKVKKVTSPKKATGPKKVTASKKVAGPKKVASPLALTRKPYEKCTVVELKVKAKDAKVKGYSKMKKAELIAALRK
jgi:large subunit ribosomal protein L21